MLELMLQVIPYNYLLDKIRNKVELSFSEKLTELIKEKGKSLLIYTKKQKLTRHFFPRLRVIKIITQPRERHLLLQ